MKALKEITNWKYPNHTYLLEHGRCVGYLQEGQTQAQMFKKPLSFSKSRRKFKEVTYDK